MKLVPNSVTRSVSMKLLTAKKNSPHIFFAAGVAGVIGSAVLACRATLRLEEVLDGIKDEVKAVKDKHLTEPGLEVELLDKVSADNYRKDMSYVYGKSSVKLVKLYGPPVVLGGVSIALLAGSHVQLVRRNAALSATLAAVTTAFDEYRDRVRNELGEEKEREIYHGIRELTSEESKEVSRFKAENGLSPYARCFGEFATTAWEPNAEINRIFLICQQNYANNKLAANGHLFLNEVYDMLGFDHSTPGAVVGWLYKGNGDGFVDFGIFETDKSNRESTIWLDFNVDGEIFRDI